jgi:choline-sulfatase
MSLCIHYIAYPGTSQYIADHGIHSDHVCADECIHHIPLIVRWPGVAATGTAPDAFLYNVDLGPTLCDLLDIPAPAGWDGQSFKGNVQGGEGLDRSYLVWDCGLYAVQRAVRTKTHLLVWTYDPYGYTFAPIELYDMTADPYQTRNQSDEQPEIVDHCGRLMADWIAEQWAKGHCIPDPLLEILGERSDLLRDRA